MNYLIASVVIIAALLQSTASIAQTQVPAATTAQVKPMALEKSRALVVAALDRGDTTALNQLRAFAEAGDPEAQRQMSYYSTEKAERLGRTDYSASLKWARMSADQGYARGQDSLAGHYLYGAGVPKDERIAFDLFLKAAAQGIARSQTEVGAAYYRGEVVPKSLEKSVYWFGKAAEQGFADAQYRLALRLANGEGVQKNEAHAAVWYRKAAEQGHSDAQNNLGYAYVHGIGVPQDENTAIMWFTKAAEQGNENARKNLNVPARRAFACDAYRMGLTRAVDANDRTGAAGIRAVMHQKGC